MKNPTSQSGLINPRVLLAAALCSAGVFLAALGFAATPTTPLAPTGPGWSIVTSPNTSATQNNYLKGVACASASDCWAVGYYLTGNNLPQTLIEHWNGTSWAIASSPNTSATQGNALSAVACASASECWAVGSYNNGNVNQTLIERWNGTSWAIVASPNNGTQGNGLSGVTCTAASECWAVGSYVYATGDLFTPSALGTLVEQWNGTSWAIVASPNAEVDFCGTLACAILDSPLVAVTCASASECWAIGSAGIDVLIERWDGSSWTIVASPSFNEQTAVPKAVTCASASECWAVGYYYDGGAADPPYYAFIERWDGTSWAFFPSPNTIANGVTCVPASDCWAVGPPIEHWDGTSWAIVTSPNTSGYLNGVTCASASECWAVGIYVNGSGYYQTLIEKYSSTVPPLTSVVSRKVHGSAGTFDIDLPLTGTGGVECRSPGATGTPGVDYKLVFSFVNNVTRCGNASIGSLSSGPGSNQCTVSLTGVPNAQYLTVTLTNVLDSQTNTGSVSGTMGVLIGDVNGNGIVSNTDVAAVKAQVAATVNSSNFRNDVNANGILSNTDVSATKAQVGTSLP